MSLLRVNEQFIQLVAEIHGRGSNHAFVTGRIQKILDEREPKNSPHGRIELSEAADVLRLTV